LPEAHIAGSSDRPLALEIWNIEPNEVPLFEEARKNTSEFVGETSLFKLM